MKISAVIKHTKNIALHVFEILVGMIKQIELICSVFGYSILYLLHLMVKLYCTKDLHLYYKFKNFKLINANVNFKCMNINPSPIMHKLL